MNHRFLGTTDTAMRLGCSAEYVRQLERAGKLPAEKMPNGRRVFLAEDVERLAQERVQKTRRKQSARITYGVSEVIGCATCKSDEDGNLLIGQPVMVSQVPGLSECPSCRATLHAGCIVAVGITRKN